MESREIKTVSELCRAAGTDNGSFGDVINLKRSPVNKKGEWIPCVLKVCEYLLVMPSELFSEEQILPLKTNKSFVDIGFEDISRVLADPTQDPSLMLEDQDAVDTVSAVLMTHGISEREREIIKLRFGFEGKEHTLQETADVFGVSKERIRQIEAKVLRKLRHQTRTAPLRLVYSSEFFGERGRAAR
jgi:RNA polymerase sigma factor (sigma-70 family)